MNNDYIVCNNCGAKCNMHDVYCKSCSHKLSSSDNVEKQIVDGIDNTELRSFIGNNADYYTEKFAKKNSKWFVQLNFAALFFGPTWFFYRKMSKIAIVYVAILILSSSLLTLLLPIVFKEDVEQYHAANEAYNEYIDSGGEIFLDMEDHDYVVGIIHPTYERISDELEAAEKRISFIEFLINAPVLLINILIRFFANSIYKYHITLNIHSNNGGVSMKNAIIGYILMYITMMIVYLLLNQIPIVARFSAAL